LPRYIFSKVLYIVTLLSLMTIYLSLRRHIFSKVLYIVTLGRIVGHVRKVSVVK
jgi:hypothetical protein